MLAPALAADPSLRIATKAGYVTAATGGDAVNAGVLTEDQAVVGHSLAPQYVRWQMGRSREQLGRERLDLVLLHNPERAHPGDRLALHRAMREAFVVLEEAVAAGHVARYGIATWAGLEEETFSLPARSGPEGSGRSPLTSLRRSPLRGTGRRGLPCRGVRCI